MSKIPLFSEWDLGSDWNIPSAKKLLEKPSTNSIRLSDAFLADAAELWLHFKKNWTFIWREKIR